MNTTGPEFIVDVNGLEVKLSNISVDDASGGIELDYEVLDRSATYCRTELEQSINTLINEALARFIQQHQNQEKPNDDTE